ncbi:MAG: hypothetical protein ACMUIU_14055 [bacterium]
MKIGIKILIFFSILSLTFVTFSSTAIAQVGFGAPPLWDFPSFQTQPLQVPTWEDPFNGKGDILVDNFEYWDSPYNHGWMQQEPAYPVYGFGIGYATIFNTVLDLQEGSRVLDVYRPPSIFLLSTPYERHQIFHSLITPPSAANSEAEACIRIRPNDDDDTPNPVVSFDFRAPIGIEPWDIFELDVIGESEDGDNTISVRIVPLQPPDGTYLGSVTSTAGMYGITAAVSGFNKAGQLQVTVAIGRGMLDGSWHAIMVDLDEAVRAALDGFDGIDDNDKPDWYMAKACAVAVSGQMFRLDNLMFRAGPGHRTIYNPDLFEMGPLYAQIFEPYRYLFIADYAGGEFTVAEQVHTHDCECSPLADLMLNPDNFIITQDPNDPNDPVVKYWTDLGADPNKFGEEADPNLEDLFGRDFIVDLSLPIFADPNLRMTTSGPGPTAQTIIDAGTLGWNATVNGYGANGIQAFLLQPLPIYPYDGMPTYIPAYYNAIDVIKTYGKAHFSPGLVFLLESALWNAGVKAWPNIAALDYTPQYFEDLIVTIEVTNGVHSDVRTFPISVVNYPVENYPPVVQLNILANVFMVGQLGEHVITFIDPDCFIFSMSPAPATTHVPGFPVSGSFRTDMDDLTFQATINGLSAYQYGPWIETIIDPCSGLISWVPKFEGANHIAVTCSDARGGTAFADTWIISVSGGTWLNHPPYIALRPTEPMVVKAGEEVILHYPQFIVVDADGDQLYASCNVGSCGRDTNGNFIWKFQSNFPGSYLVEIVFYDIRGGYAIMELFLDVKPWWSY